MQRFDNHIDALVHLRESLKDKYGKVEPRVLNALKDHQDNIGGVHRRVGNKTRLVPAVGAKRVYRLLEKYGEGRYRIEVAI